MMRTFLFLVMQGREVQEYFQWRVNHSIWKEEEGHEKFQSVFHVTILDIMQVNFRIGRRGENESQPEVDAMAKTQVDVFCKKFE